MLDCATDHRTGEYCTTAARGGSNDGEGGRQNDHPHISTSPPAELTEHPAPHRIGGRSLACVVRAMLLAIPYHLEAGLSSSVTTIPAAQLSLTTLHVPINPNFTPHFARKFDPPAHRLAWASS
mgnify:CR=1 FL=1